MIQEATEQNRMNGKNVRSSHKFLPRRRVVNVEHGRDVVLVHIQCLGQLAHVKCVQVVILRTRNERTGTLSKLADRSVDVLHANDSQNDIGPGLRPECVSWWTSG